MATVEKVFFDGDDYFKEMHEAIQSAKKSVYIETYIFDQDQLGNRTLDLLAKTAQKGLKVQLLLDGVGSTGWTFGEAEFYRKKGIDLQFFHPLVWQRHPSNVLRSLTLARIITGFSKLNHRNHRKICIIDEEILFICSMNISDRHLKSVYGEKAWHDAGVRTEGDGVKFHLQSCNETWKFSHQFFGKRWLKARVEKKKAREKILKLIYSATEKIWITNPYFVPDLRLLKALYKVARSGIDVKLLVPLHSDILGLKFAMQSFYTALLKRSCQIFEYTPSILHAKILIVDNWASIGSTNLDYRSTFYNLEADIVLSQPENVEIVKQQFLEDLKVSKQVNLKEWIKGPWYNRVLQRFFLFFRGVF